MKAKILIVLLCAILVMTMAGCIQPEMAISGIVTDYSSGELLKGEEVSVYTSQQLPLEYHPPLGQKITNKFEYAEGEVVTFWIENICNETINLMNGAPWRIQKKTNGGWKNVFVPMGIQVIIPIVPGENMSWSWDQRGQYANYTGSGTYRVVLEYEGGEVETEFKICKATKLRYIDITLGPRSSDSALYILDVGIVKTVKCHFYYSAEHNASFYQKIETRKSVVDEAKKTGEYKPFVEEEKIEGGETSEYLLSNVVFLPIQMWYIAHNNCSVPIHIYGTVETKI